MYLLFAQNCINKYKFKFVPLKAKLMSLLKLIYIQLLMQGLNSESITRPWKPSNFILTFVPEYIYDMFRPQKYYWWATTWLPLTRCLRIKKKPIKTWRWRSGELTFDFWHPYLQYPNEYHTAMPFHRFHSCIPLWSYTIYYYYRYSSLTSQPFQS